MSKEITISKFSKRLALKPRRGSSRKSFSNIAIYAGSLLVLAVLVSSGYKSPSVEANREQNSLLKTVSVAAAAESSPAPAVIDEVQAANLAADVATNANLSVADSVSNQSISISAGAELEQHETVAISKPQITDPAAKIEALSSYLAVDGDTATIIAAKFGISDQTVRWANNLKDDAVAAGATLTIPAVDGVIYTFKDGDNLAAVAEKYGSTVDGIIEANNLDSDVVAGNTKLLLPGGVLPESERPGYRAPNSARATVRNSYSSRDTGAASSNYVPYTSGNTYAYGYCTWYAYNRRVQMGMPLPSNLGNANTWHTRARAAGYLVNRSPSVGAVIQTTAGGYGHVGVVEKINADGTIEISEMNNRAYGGWGRINSRTVTNPGDYNYIH